MGRGTGDAADEALLLDGDYALPAAEQAAPQEASSEEPKSPEHRPPARWPVALAVLAMAGWTGFYAWAAWDQLRALPVDPRSAAGLIAEWAVPVLLIGVVWLLAMRHSRAEAARFARSAALLREESAALEARLTTVNRELSLAREFLAAEARELESLGRIAAERLSKHAAELQNLIQHNGAEVSAIAATSESALANMSRLRDDLPVVANSARDATNQIGKAGLTAQEQLGKLVAGFERLNQFGTATTAQVASLEARIGEAVGVFAEETRAVEALVSARFAELRAEAESFRAELDAQEAAALAALAARSREIAGEATAFATQLDEAESAARLQLKDRFASLHHEMLEKLSFVEEADRKIAAAAEARLATIRAELAQLGEAMTARGQQLDEALEQRQAAFETRAAQASEILAQRLAELDDALAQRREAQLAETEKLVAESAAMAGQLDALGALIAQIAEASAAARGALAEGLGALGADLTAQETALAATRSEIAALTEASVRLLEIIQSGARFTREELAEAITGALGALETTQTRAEAVRGLMLESASQGARIDHYLITAREEIAATDGEISALAASLAAASEDTLARLQGLRGGFARLAEESGAFTAASQEALRASLGEIEAALGATLAALDETAASRLPALAEAMGGEAIAALERALRLEAAATIGKLEQSAAHASGIGREAVVQLRDQLALVNELTGNLEQRVARARELAEEQVNNDFARRMALITDSLNSAAIDITSALSAEVSDTAWEAYLKGDRGVFTRRAVRLIDAATARQIGEMYQRDEAFRSHVARYIHDFEAMLRSLLSTRAGNVMSVTLLGSDMGKLYVVLAQAIQRLRA